MTIDRIPFAEAIQEKLLLKNMADGLSKPQLAALKGFYGCALDPEEQLYWSLLQGHGTFDELGFPLSMDVRPYEPREYADATAIWGRRSGKTHSFSAPIVCYEAALGGHEAFIKRGAQTAVCFLIAQDLKMAREALGVIKATLDSSPLLRNEIANLTADFVLLKNGIAIGVAPPNIKAVRGYAVPVVVMDEIGVWYKTAESANPDYEVERAVRYAQMQFPNKKRVRISTPYIKEGLLWEKWKQGTTASHLLLHAPTAALQNPLITREVLHAERDQDAEAFERECLARFVDALSGFLNPSLLQEAVELGVSERAPQPLPAYVAALDPAFRRDAFAFTVVHHDPELGVIQDVQRHWRAPHGEALNPESILQEIAPICQQFRINSVASDQYQLESLKQLALGHGLSLYGLDFTARSKAKVLGSLQQLVNTKRLKLLDIPEQTAELLSLERRHMPSGGVQISAPRGRHDDLATVLALAAHQAIWQMPHAEKPQRKEPTASDLCWAQIKRKRAGELGGYWRV